MDTSQRPEDAAWLRKGFVLGARSPELSIWAHPDSGYRKRTAENAACDATMASAADYSTGGERLTKQMAGSRYVPLALFLDPDEAGRRLAEFMKGLGARSLNVAGNGIYTLSEKHWTQEAANQWIHDCLAEAASIRPIARVQSGGQTGIDMAGAIAAIRLGIPATLLMPAGFKQRNAQARDFDNDPAALLESALAASRELLPWPRPAPGSAPRP